MVTHPHLPHMLYLFRFVIDTFQNVDKFDLLILKHQNSMMYNGDPNTQVCFDFAEDVDNDVFLDAWTAQQYIFAETH